MTILERLRKKFPVLVPPKIKANARVAIAKDVIETLVLGRMQACAGTYLRTDVTYGENEELETLALRMRQPYGSVNCEACALGAAAICAIGLYDRPGGLQKEWEQFEGFEQETLHGVLGRWFTSIQLDLIECAFEEVTIHTSGVSDFDSRYDAQQFGYEYKEDHDRLVAIMQNIVANHGTFRP